MGPMRVHLRKHLGLRPFKCALCDYRHWEKNNLLSAHFILAHGRKSVDSDAILLPEVDKQLEDEVEKGILEIREIQIKIKNGEPVGPKKSTPREFGRVFRGGDEERAYRPNYQANGSWEVDKDSTEKNNESSNTSNTELPSNATRIEREELASKLSKAYNTQKNLIVPSGKISPEKLFRNHIPPSHTGNSTVPNAPQNHAGSPNNSNPGNNNQTNTNIPTGQGQSTGSHTYDNTSTTSTPTAPLKFSVNQNPHLPRTISPSQQTNTTTPNGTISNESQFQNKSLNNFTIPNGSANLSGNQVYSYQAYNNQSNVPINISTGQTQMYGYQQQSNPTNMNVQTNQYNFNTFNGSGNLTESQNFSYQTYNNQPNMNMPTGQGQINGFQLYNTQPHVNSQAGPQNFVNIQEFFVNK